MSIAGPLPSARSPLPSGPCRLRPRSLRLWSSKSAWNRQRCVSRARLRIRHRPRCRCNRRRRLHRLPSQQKSLDHGRLLSDMHHLSRWWMCQQLSKKVARVGERRATGPFPSLTAFAATSKTPRLPLLPAPTPPSHLSLRPRAMPQTGKPPIWLHQARLLLLRPGAAARRPPVAGPLRQGEFLKE